VTPADFNDAVMRYCDLAHASVTSGYRTVAHNHDKHGVTYSPHLFGLGADVVYDDGADMGLRAERARRLGLRLLVEADHDHLQPWDWQAG
jgi:hypothetical protein